MTVDMGVYDEEQIALMEEVCIRVDTHDTALGPITKKQAHLMENIKRGNDALHRAFSVFLFNGKNELMLQQRASSKITFPLHWTNTCCSHPLHTQTELTDDAVVGIKRAAVRKMQHELGVNITESQLKFLTRILYKAESDGIWGEHEVDYILIMKVDEDTVPMQLNAGEVAGVKYVWPDELKSMFGSVEITPWFQLICEHFLFKWWQRMIDDGPDSLNSDQLIHNMN
jgi:isopentenyl-diphosphate Delta-isomerase